MIADDVKEAEFFVLTRKKSLKLNPIPNIENDRLDYSMTVTKY